MTRKKPTAFIFCLSICLAVTMLSPCDVQAATKTPAKPIITSAKATDNTVRLTWKKAKNAKSYKVFVQKGKDGWKYWKKVKATSKNKKKYSDTLKYKLKKSGKKYKVYKKKNPYKLVKTTKARKYTYKGKYSTTYRFVLQAVNGKKAGAYSAAKKATTKAKPTPQPADPTTTTDPTTPSPTVPAPGKVSNLKAEFKVVDGTNWIYVTWNAASDATSYDVYRKKGTGASATSYPSTPNAKDKTECKYSLKDASNNQVYFFKVVAKNSAGTGAPVEVSITTPAAPETPTTPTTGPYSTNRTTAWNQYLEEMFGYYKKELKNNQGVEINSTNKADEFKKLQAIIQVMHDYVGYSEHGTTDFSHFPTGCDNWMFYSTNVGADLSGDYYNGENYVSTIKFYGACDDVAETQEYLAEKAGLDIYKLVNKRNHVYTMICANNIWYNADPAKYMVAGSGLNSINPMYDPSSFGEADCDIGHRLSTGTTFNITDKFKLSKVFYKSSESISDAGGLRFINNSGDIGINPANATYTSSDESILSFDDTNGTCTFHQTGMVYVTITYQNLIASGQPKSITTTISVKVTN